MLLSELKAARQQAGLTQYDLAKRLSKSQSFVGKLEMGERRMDVVQLRDFCHAIGIPFAAFIARYEDALAGSGEQTATEPPKSGKKKTGSE